MTAASSTPAVEATPLSSIPRSAWFILALMTLDTVLGVIDRQAISVLKTTLKEVFTLTDGDYSLLVTAFLVPYAIFYVICGRLTDRLGSRVMLTACVAIWSLATIGSGLARSFGELALWRAVLGAAEAGLLPASFYALVRWFPKDRLGFANGVKAPFNALGPILTAPIIVGLTLAFGWRAAFIVPGVIGLAFAAAWWWADRSPPDYAAPDRTTSKARIGFAILKSPLLWGIVVARIVSDPLWFFQQYWQAGYLQEVLGLTLADVGRVLWIPPLISGVVMLGVGVLSDRLVRAGWSGPKSRIRIMQFAALGAPLVVLIPLTRDPSATVALLTFSYLLGASWLFLSNLLVADLFRGAAVGTAIGLMNAIGTLGAAIFNAFVGVLLDSLGGYLTIFLILATLHPIAAVILQVGYRGLLSARPEPASTPQTPETSS